MSFRALSIVIQRRPLVKSTTGFSFAVVWERKVNEFQEKESEKRKVYAASAFRCEKISIYDLFTAVYFMDIKLTPITSLTDKVSVSCFSMSMSEGCEFLILVKALELEFRKRFFLPWINKHHQDFSFFITHNKKSFDIKLQKKKRIRSQ